MNGKTYINGDELTALANSLKSKSENILSTYKGDCSTAIQMSSECLQLSGLNITEFFQALEKVYNQVNERITSFADFLNNVVVAEYNAVSEAIVSSFNNDFANEMASLLGISVTGIVGLGTMKPIQRIPNSPAASGQQQPESTHEENRIITGYETIKGSSSAPKFLKPKVTIIPEYGKVSIPKQPKEQVIELDPREREGFINKTIQWDKPIVFEKNSIKTAISVHNREQTPSEVITKKTDLHQLSKKE